MGTIDAVFIESTNSVFLVMVLIVLILILFISSSSFSSKRNVKEPPGPRAFPLLGNLLQLDLKRLDISLMEVSFFCGNFSGIFSPPCGSFFTFDLPMSVKISTYSTVLSYLRNMDQSSPSIWDLKKSGGTGRIQDSEGGTCWLHVCMWRQDYGGMSIPIDIFKKSKGTVEFV